MSKKATCLKCSRATYLVSVGGSTVAFDPEIIRVARVSEHGRPMSAAELMPARRLHAEMCDIYQRARERPMRRMGKP